MHGIGAPIVQFFLLTVMLFLGSMVLRSEVLLDSIRLDGKILLIDAQVRFDSTDFRKEGGSSSSRTRDLSRRGRSSYFIAHVGLGVPEVQASGSSVASWTRQSLPVYSLGGGTVWPAWTKRTTPAGALESLWSVDRLDRVALDLNALPDSLIGFVQSEETRGLEGVVYERFPIGVETDTVPIAIVSSALWRASFQIGWTSTWHTHWSWHAAIGASVLLMPEEAMRLYAPDLAREQPVAVAERLSGQLIPLVDVSIHRRLTSSRAYVDSPFTIGLHARLQSGAQFWMGLQMRWYPAVNKN